MTNGEASIKNVVSRFLSYIFSKSMDNFNPVL